MDQSMKETEKKEENKKEEKKKKKPSSWMSLEQFRDEMEVVIRSSE